MIQLRIFIVGMEQEPIIAPTYGQAFDKATDLGAKKAIDGHSQKWLFIEGEWVCISMSVEGADD
jgi:hypothetical protein